VSSFKDCALAFRFAYVDRLPEPPSVPASRGTLVHRALEHLMTREPGDRTREAAHADLATAIDELRDHPEFAGLGLTPDEQATFEGEAAELVDRYFQLEDPRMIRPIGIELKMQAALSDDVVIRGIIDRLELDEDGELVVTDYKTGRVPGEQWEQKSLQGVHVYALLCQEMLGRRPARVQLLYLSEPASIVATPTEQSVRGVARRNLAVYEAVRGACRRDDFRPSPGPRCDWCSFRKYCPAFGGDPADAVELRIEAAENEAIAAGNPPLFTASGAPTT